jgi:transcriptional repressor NF-X1
MVVDPKPPRLATPHSCANPCGRARTCSHPCPLPCHPGPCPPCAVTTAVPCHCGKHTRSFRCSNLVPRTNGGQPEMSCAQTCGKKLGCGSHICPKICHPGPCGSCEVTVTSRCWCGKEERDLGCGKGTPRESVVISDSGEEDRWIGRFECTNLCNR